MRDWLTGLGALVVLALLAALVGPGFIDWRNWRSEIDRQLATALGVSAASHGAVSLALLPHPRLSIENIRLAGDDATHLEIARLRLELAVPPLLKGELHVTDAAAEGAVLTLAADEEGRLILPRIRQEAAFSEAAVERLSLSGARLVLTRPQQPPLSIGPIAAEVQAARLAGPWKIEAEVAGQPLRLITGAHEPGHGLTVKLSSNAPARRIDMDGVVQFSPSAGALALSWAGSASLVVKGEEAESAPLATASLRGTAAGGRLMVEALSLDLDGIGHVEGSGDLPFAQPARGSLVLSARRLEAEGWPVLPQLSRRLIEGVGGARGPALDIALSIDQLIWRGEEIADVKAAMTFDGRQLAISGGKGGFAGASFQFSGAVDAQTGDGEGTATVSAPALQRVALAASRAGLAPEAADALSSLGALELELAGRWTGSARSLSRLVARTRLGEVSATGSISAEGARLTAAATGLDVAALAGLKPLLPPLEAQLPVELDLRFDGLRVAASAPGSAAILASRREGVWRIGRLEASGFGGLTLASQAEGPNGVRAQLTAPQAGAVLAVAGLTLPDPARRWLGRRAALFSPLRLDVILGGLDQPAVGWRADGRLGAFGMVSSGSVSAGAQFGAFRVEASAEAASFMALAGLPASSPTGDSLSLSLEAKGADAKGGRELAASLSGAGIQASWRGGRAGEALWEGALAAQMPAGRLVGRLSWGAEGWALDKARLTGPEGEAALSLTQRAEGTLTGSAEMERLDLSTLTLLGWGRPNARGGYDAPPGLPSFRLAVKAGELRQGGVLLGKDWRATLEAGDGALVLQDMAGALAGGRLTGDVRLGQEGSLRSFRARLALEGADAGPATGGRVAGVAALRLDVGSAAETPARLMSTLSGIGQLSLSRGRLTQFAPAALPSLLGTEAEAGAPAPGRDRFAAALAKGDWPLGDVTAPLTLSGGVLRLGAVTSVVEPVRLQLGGTLDLRNGQIDLRALLAPHAPGEAHGDTPAQAVVVWSGPMGAPERRFDLAAVENVFAARALRRELERVDALEADARERRFFARRLRSERLARENQARQEAEAIMGRKALPPAGADAPLNISPLAQ